MVSYRHFNLAGVFEVANRAHDLYGHRNSADTVEGDGDIDLPLSVGECGNQDLQQQMFT